jgi:hypothetical protein
MDKEKEKFMDNKNDKPEDKKGDNLSPRKYKEHQTDDKEDFNEMYQREGRKD